MNIKSLIDETSGRAPAQSLATAFGVDPDKAALALDIMAQSLSDRIERNTLSRGGVADIFDLLARPGAGAALGKPEKLASPQIEQAGIGILEVLLGSKHASRGVAARTARATGINEETVKKMLPAVASLVMGALQAKSMPQIEKSILALPALGSPLPLPGDRPSLPRTSGSGSGSTAGRSGSPLPIPGDDIPGIEGPSRFPQLPDVIRRGGRDIQIPSPGGAGGGSLDEIIRQILANVLGFKNGGVLAFIMKIIFSRWFLGLLSRILFRR